MIDDVFELPSFVFVILYSNHVTPCGRYNSRAPPPVYLYTQEKDHHNTISFKLIRNQTTSEMLKFWGTTT